ncbi:hypothetical protein SK128_010909 [Halocaridina rubra]|uniref:protein-tyrosine-phosphatase n=1 Tax=Halocaridina rubra TaxID=373956 RepID=A0AAN8XG45_HALRR
MMGRNRWTMLQAVTFILYSALTDANPMLAPTSSWSGSLKGRTSGLENPEQYPRGNMGNIPRTLNFPPSTPEDRYIMNSRHQYQYGNYQHHIDAKPHSLDYDLEAPYQREVNLYEYSYTESSNYNDQSKNYNGGASRPMNNEGGRIPRRYGERVWWPPVPIPVLSRGASYIGRSSTQQRIERPLNNPESGDIGRYHYGAQEEGSMSGTDHRASRDRGFDLHNDSLIGMVRVQKSLQPSRDASRRQFAVVQSIEPTTSEPEKQRGFDSLLKMMTEADEEGDADSNSVDFNDHRYMKNQISENPNEIQDNYKQNIKTGNNSRQINSNMTNGANSSASNLISKTDSSAIEEIAQVEHLPRVGDAGEPSTPVTTTAVLGSIMLMIIIVMVMVALRVQWRERVKDAEDWGVRSPTVQPPTPAATSVGPSMSPSHLDPLNHLQAEPVRIKAKGLLERRGSNTSLTLELAPNCPPPEVSSPPRHCTPEEFLSTAGNRMSRRQLRNCLCETRLLHAEFWEVPLNHPDKCDVPGSGAKNRYRTVLPNEGTRVHLGGDDPINDYINANYVRGYDGEEKAYIVTQGPLAHTVVDLWSLVLQEKAPAVVMITRLKEKRRVKCEPYIPAFSATYGAITVTVKQVIQKNGYTIRQIVLQRGETMHETLHFWYTAWPDHKTPTEPDQLLAMAVQVDHIRKSGEGGTRGPVVVHCSAGIGRSGCFVAISIAINQLLEEDCVDILGILCQMRLDRGGMVQTGEQYEFIHRAVALYEATLPIVCSSGK